MGKKGFGQSEPPTRKAKKFMRAFMERVADNQAQANQFFISTQAQLDESLLEALPLVFATFTADKLPEERENIAQLFLTFGDLIQQFPLGDRMLNLELAITAYRLALKVYTRKGSPEDWAALQNNLGIAYLYRIRGDRADNLEQAIVAYQLALKIHTHQEFPKDWAALQNNLGNAYKDRIRGERAENLEQAITAYQLALQVRTREVFPKDWAITQNNLGTAYLYRIQGERAENLEQAITAFKLALKICTCEAFPEQWAGIQNNLGTAYLYRIQGERAENLEQSIAAYQLAFQVYTHEAFPEQWATTQTNLGNAYRDRIIGEQTDNLEQAISTYKQAAQVFNCKAFPEKWAENQGNLAEALIKRAALKDNSTDLDTAISLLQQTLDVAVTGSPDFIDSQYQLGNALSRRYNHSQNPNDLQQALQAYKIVLNAISPEHYDRKQIWQALPTTQSILGSRLVREGRWQEGLQLLLNSVNQLSTGGDPLAHANALFQTGRAHEFLSDWDNARLYYRDALRLYEHLNDQPGIAKSRAGLGGVLVSQGHLEKGMTELAKAVEDYHQLQKPSQAAEIDHLYQAAQRAMERQAAEAYV
jgi:tetratricopeptide (TPR) repeat protein